MVESREGSSAVQLLSKCELFQELDTAELSVLAKYAVRRSYDPGTMIFCAGDPGDSLMGIVSGEVRISRPTADGDEIIIAIFGPGRLFGEIAVLDGQGRSADALAVTKVDVVVLERRSLVPFILERPVFGLELLKLICGKLRAADERSSDFLFLELSARLAKALLRLCTPSQAVGRAGRTHLTQGEIARIVGATRTNVNRQLKKWERDGLVEMRKGWIVVNDRDALATVAKTYNAGTSDI